jgi:hypothetical protein
MTVATKNPGAFDSGANGVVLPTETKRLGGAVSTVESDSDRVRILNKKPELRNSRKGLKGFPASRSVVLLRRRSVRFLIL